MLLIEFHRGTLLLAQPSEFVLQQFPSIQWDPRVRKYRAPAYLYRNLVIFLRNQKIEYQDQARAFTTSPFSLQEQIIPRTYQQEAMQAFHQSGQQGVVVLPTGAGKTIVAVLLIVDIQRPTLIHVPTIDLMHQWVQVLTKYFGVKIGMLGGGFHEIAEITVATYDSALIHIERKGNQFGFLVFDECHHLPSNQFQMVAMSSIAPFRLGLTATPERSDSREYHLYEICGPLCYQAHIEELEGQTLSPYEVVTIEVTMLPSEKEKYDKAREEYVSFVRKEKIYFSSPGGWREFLWKSSRSQVGRSAFKAYLQQKQLSQASSAKENWIWKLLQQHLGDRILIFTQDNQMAYRIGHAFFLPVLTHHTKPKEREQFLQSFRDGKYSILVTSKVLNEGVDVPEANVAIIVSGSGSVREHVQRLGRILRAKVGKKAFLYELISKGTGEYQTHKRRRQHGAYQRFKKKGWS